MDRPKKRRRVITSCVECYRRKQRCNRVHPCNICSARNVTCSYLDSAYGLPGPAQSLTPPPKRQREEEDGVLERASKLSDLSDQIGYSQRDNSNALKTLEKSLPSEKASFSGIVKPSKSMLIAYLTDKFCASVALLPQREPVNELIDLFFIEANSHVGVLDRYFFRKAQEGWDAVTGTKAKNIRLEGVSRDTLCFPAVLFQVLAVSLQYVTLDTKVARLLGLRDYVAVDDLSQEYTQHGMNIMKLLGRHSPTVMSVHHDLMRAFWLKNCSRGTESWYILGDAIRQAQDLGLHLDGEVSDEGSVERTLENLWYDEWKKRLWVSLFNWDAHMALVLGRPRSINSSDCTVKPPLDCNMPDSPPTTVPTNAALTRTPSSFTRHLFNNFISHRTHEMLSLGANRRYVKDYSIVKKLQDDVLRKLEQLPPTARPNNTDTSWDDAYPYLPKQREHILTFAHSFLVALHRPHSAVHEESRRAAILSSLAVLESQQRLFSMTPTSHYRSFGASFYTVDASLFLSTAILEDPSTNLELLNRIHEALRQAIDRLNILKSRSPMAESGVKLLERCHKRIKAERPQVNGTPDSGQLWQSTQLTPSLVSNPTPLSGNSIQDFNNGAVDSSPEYADFDWAFPASNASSSLEFDMIGNVTDFNASFWTEQMSSILNSNADATENDDSLWSFLMAATP